MLNDTLAIEHTRTWLQQFVIQHSICPFAQYPYEHNLIHYQVIHSPELESCLTSTMMECARLDAHTEIETSLLLFTQGFDAFDDFLDLLYLAEELIVAQGYAGVYQLASFHPDYCFEGVPSDDAANFTNRSPYPMLHLIREASITKVLASYPDPENIPARNIAHTRELGSAHWQQLLLHCRKP